MYDAAMKSRSVERPSSWRLQRGIVVEVGSIAKYVYCCEVSKGNGALIVDVTPGDGN